MINKIVACCFLQVVFSLFFIQSPDFIYVSNYLSGCLSFLILCVFLLNYKIKRIKKYVILISFFTFQLVFVLSERYLHKISCIIYVLVNKEDLEHKIINKMELNKEYIYLKNPSFGVTELKDADLQAYLKKRGYLMVLKQKNNSIHFRFETEKFRIIALNYCPDKCQNDTQGNEKLIKNWYSQIIY